MSNDCQEWRSTDPLNWFKKASHVFINPLFYIANDTFFFFFYHRPKNHQPFSKGRGTKNNDCLCIINTLYWYILLTVIYLASFYPHLFLSFSSSFTKPQPINFIFTDFMHKFIPSTLLLPLHNIHCWEGFFAFGNK